MNLYHISSKTSHITSHKSFKSSQTSHIISHKPLTHHYIPLIHHHKHVTHHHKPITSSKSSQNHHKTSHILTQALISYHHFTKPLSHYYEHLHTHQQSKRAKVQSSEEQQKTTKGEKRILAPTFMVAWVEYGDRGSVVRFRSALVRTSECDHASGIVHVSCERDVCSFLVG